MKYWINFFLGNVVRSTFISTINYCVIGVGYYTVRVYYHQNYTSRQMYVKSSESFQFLKYNMFYYKKLFWSILTLPLKLSYFEYLDVIFKKCYFKFSYFKYFDVIKKILELCDKIILKLGLREWTVIYF